MRQEVLVNQILGDGRAEVRFTRPSACSGDCEHCAGSCTAAKETLLVPARNLIGAQPGDRVYIEASSRHVFTAIILVYCLPVVLFFAGYGIGELLGAPQALCGGIGFALGLASAVPYDRHVRHNRSLSYTIVAFAAQR